MTKADKDSRTNERTIKGDTNINTTISKIILYRNNITALCFTVLVYKNNT